MFKKILTLILTVAMILSAFTFTASAVFSKPVLIKNGDPLGDVLYSDITAYINGRAIPASIRNGMTMVVVEDLANYGFDVVWNGKDRTLRVELNANKKITPLPVEKNTKPVGAFKCKYVYTDIKTYLSKELVESFAISGVTLIDFELLAKYGSIKWDGKARTISLTTGKAADPFKPGRSVIITPSNPLSASFIEYGTECYFNEFRIIAAENNPGKIGNAGLTVSSNYAWAPIKGGNKRCLMILVDVDDFSVGSANYSLHLPKYGLPVISRIKYNIYIEWENPANPDDRIALMFEDESNLMTVHVNTSRVLKPSGKSETVEMAVSVYGDGSGHKFYIPLYAILNQVGGGVVYDPMGDGSAFIFTGDVLTAGGTGMWETSDRGDMRRDVVINGKKHSVAEIWLGLELFPDGKFIESSRYYMFDEWVLTEHKGRYAFFGRILVMLYETESEYGGKDYAKLKPIKLNAPAEGWGQVTGACMYARYVDEWDETCFWIKDRHIMYYDLAAKGEASPRPGKTK